MPWDLLVPHLERAGADVGGAMDRLRRYSELLLQWNRTVSNLISGHDEGRLVQRHLVESLEPADWLREAGHERWMDFGAGAGLPGFPLAIAGIGREWLMVESRRPKALFMRKCVQEMKIENIEVHHGRLEELVASGSEAGRIQGMVSRATLHLSPTLVLAKSLVAHGGSAFLWKGSRRHDEMIDQTPWSPSWEFQSERILADGQTAVLKLMRI